MCNHNSQSQNMPHPLPINKESLTRCWSNVPNNISTNTKFTLGPKKNTWVFLYIKYSKFWSVSLEHFGERKRQMAWTFLLILPQCGSKNNNKPKIKKEDDILSRRRYLTVDIFAAYIVILKQFFPYNCTFIIESLERIPLYFSKHVTSCI